MGNIIRATQPRRAPPSLHELSRRERQDAGDRPQIRCRTPVQIGEVVGEIVPQDANYFSLLAEAVEDRVGYMLAVLDLQCKRKNDAAA